MHCIMHTEFIYIVLNLHGNASTALGINVSGPEPSLKLSAVSSSTAFLLRLFSCEFREGESGKRLMGAAKELILKRRNGNILLGRLINTGDLMNRHGWYVHTLKNYLISLKQSAQSPLIIGNIANGTGEMLHDYSRLYSFCI